MFPVPTVRSREGYPPPRREVHRIFRTAPHSMSRLTTPKGGYDAHHYPKAKTFTGSLFVVYLCNASVESTRSGPLPVRPWRRVVPRRDPPNPGLPARRPCLHSHTALQVRTTTAMRFGGGVTARPCPHRVMSVCACVRAYVGDVCGWRGKWSEVGVFETSCIRVHHPSHAESLVRARWVCPMFGGGMSDIVRLGGLGVVGQRAG